METYNDLQKNKPYRSKKYLEFVRSQPCCVSGRIDDIQAHHPISCGLGGTMGGKVSDLFAIPLNTEIHARLHAFPQSVDIDQKAEALRMIEKAMKAGVINIV